MYAKIFLRQAFNNAFSDEVAKMLKTSISILMAYISKPVKTVLQFQQTLLPRKFDVKQHVNQCFFCYCFVFCFFLSIHLLIFQLYDSFSSSVFLSLIER